MADTTTKIISELDFEKIKANLSAFIANNSDFTDYNFEGSALSFLTDILAYNTHYNAVYLNMALNENFIDTAVTRSSVVSLAKNLGYTPRSRKSSLTEISFTITETDPLKANGNVIYLEKSNYFRCENNGVTYIFSPVKQTSATSVSGVYTFSDIALREGSYVTVKYPVLGITNEKFILNNFAIDLDSILVTVQNSPSDTTITTYSLISDITALTPDSTIFYLFETTDRRYEISFGDGVLGKKLTSGNIVNITYQTSSGADGNGCENFVLSNQIDGRFDYADINFTNVLTSYGGDQEENLDSIRLSALQNFRTQGRAVTTEDYKFFIERDYPLAESISVWGGQDNIPPIYGKVFISFKPAGGYFLNAAQKQDILDNIIKPYNIVTVIPEIIDPEYTFIEVDSSVKYNPARTVLSAGQIKSAVTESISTYSSNTLTKFGTSFSYSKFVTLIDKSDSSIVGNVTAISLRKNFVVNLNERITYTLDFQNQIHPGSIRNKFNFYATGDVNLGYPSEALFLEDDEEGKIRIYKTIGTGLESKKIILSSSVGTVNYSTGIITLTIKPSKTNSDNTLDIIAKPAQYSIGDINSYNNNILLMVDSDVTVNVKEV
jgi:hypothetical protein